MIVRVIFPVDRPADAHHCLVKRLTMPFSTSNWMDDLPFSLVGLRLFVILASIVWYVGRGEPNEQDGQRNGEVHASGRASRP